MHVFIVMKVQYHGRYDDMDADVDVLLVTEDSAKAEAMVALGKRLGVELEMRECEVE